MSAEAKQRDYEAEKRRAFQRAKGMTNKQFWDWMNTLHTRAFRKADSQWQESIETALPPRYQKQVKEELQKIRGEWDNLEEVNIDFSEFTLQDTMIEVQIEMQRAAKIHGVAFKSLEEAREAIIEEHNEVWQAVEEGDMEHAKVEAIQLIGVLIKFIRTVH